MWIIITIAILVIAIVIWLCCKLSDKATSTSERIKENAGQQFAQKNQEK